MCLFLQGLFISSPNFWRNLHISNNLNRFPPLFFGYIQRNVGTELWDWRAVNMVSSFKKGQGKASLQLWAFQLALLSETLYGSFRKVWIEDDMIFPGLIKTSLCQNSIPNWLFCPAAGGHQCSFLDHLATAPAFLLSCAQIETCASTPADVHY